MKRRPNPLPPTGKKPPASRCCWGPAVLITGASSGIGFAFAKHYAKQNQSLLLVSANAKRLQSAQEQLKTLSPRSASHCFTYPVNLTDPKAVKKVFSFAARKKLQLTTLVNNAGVGFLGKAHAMEEEKVEEVCRLNIEALTKFSLHFIKQHQAVPPLQAPILINVSSVAGFVPSPYFSVYSATKSYVTAFTTALARETEALPVPIQVLTLCPGPTATAFFKRATSGAGAGPLPARRFTSLSMTSEAVVEEALVALRKKQVTRVCGGINRLRVLTAHFFPATWVSWATKRIFLRLLKNQ